MLRQLRWRKQPGDRRGLWLSLAAVLLLHGLFAWFVWGQMHSLPAMAAEEASPSDNAIEVRFIPGSTTTTAPAMRAPPERPNPPPAEVPPPKTLPARPRVAKPEAPAKDAMTVQLPATRPDDAPPLKLFDKSGQPLLPTSATSAPPPEADYVERTPTDRDGVMQHTNPIKYVPTRFDKHWQKGSSVDDALQKVVDATTVKKTVTLPKGVHLHCAVSLAMLAGGCGFDPPAPPSKKGGDERLSMAPSQPLAKDPHPPTPPTVDECIAMYRAEKPLEYGCPVDTPNRSIDAEKAARAAVGKP